MKNMLRLLAACGCAAGSSGLASGTMTGMLPMVTISTNQGVSTLDSVALYAPLSQPLLPGESAVMQPLNPAYASPLMVSYTVTDVFATRKVSFTYRSLGTQIATRAGYDSLDQPEAPNARFGLVFRFTFAAPFDTEWIGTPIQTDAFLYSDGRTSSRHLTGSQLSFSAQGVNYIDDVRASDTGFWNVNGPIDEYVHSFIYTAPAPGSIGVVGGVLGFAAASRRRPARS